MVGEGIEIGGIDDEVDEWDTTAFNEANRGTNVPSRDDIEAFAAAAMYDDVSDLRPKIGIYGKNILDATDSEGYTALHRSCLRVTSACFDYLVSLGADVNKQSNVAHLTPLMTCARRGDGYKLNVLLTKGADVLRCDQFGFDAVAHAEQKGFQGQTALLKTHKEGALARIVAPIYEGVALPDAATPLKLQPKKIRF